MYSLSKPLSRRRLFPSQKILSTISYPYSEVVTIRTKHLSIDEAKDFLYNPSLEDNLFGSQETPRLRNDKLARAALRVSLRQDLTNRQRKCVELHYIQGLTLEETGKRLGIGKSTVHKHIELAKQHISRALAYAAAIQAAINEEED